MGKKKILVIDDEPDFTGMLKLNLEETGEYEVREVNEGTRALAAAREFQPDLIFLDIMMPDLSGGEVAQQIDEDHALKGTPIVFLTALVKKEEEQMIGNRPFVAKPPTLDKVVDTIKRFAR